MKRRDLIRHLRAYGCDLLSEGSSHSIFVNRAAKAATSVPRHKDINDFLCAKICNDLNIPKP